MRFANLVWAIAHRGFRRFQVSSQLKISESRFSRALNGRSEFRGAERAGIARLLNYPEQWLFEETRPPPSSPGPISVKKPRPR
jgi:hypothetical protein